MYNDIDEDLTYKILKFADNTRITKRVTTVAEKKKTKLQSQLDCLVSCSNEHKVACILKMCKNVQIPNCNIRSICSMNNFEFLKVNEEKDLGVNTSDFIAR